MKTILTTGLPLCLSVPALVAHASGVLPESSVVILNEADGETTMNVKNTESMPLLLHTTIQNTPDDQELLVVAVPPVSRVEGQDTQLVRFMLQSPAPLQVQRLKRVTFEGIPPKGPDGKARISMTIRQNLPLIVHPAKLEKHASPWTLLKWSVAADGKLRARNDSPYVVRLGQGVQLMPEKTAVDLGKTYVLPGSTVEVPLPSGAGARATSVRLSPATIYGYEVDTYDAPLVDTARQP
ncbi:MULTISPECIES: fimbria/pilus chaperone family protein [Burkholderia]|jgi:P pilus assembly chaperone PapD|nr:MULTISPECIES: fimbria/pilus chaperone family protein [Burkholderia]UTP27042.1 fimbria/pilus chaperone family protein [Burkholderia sp. FXe9]KKL42812.1 fimbrial chaperone protein [Burkholderia contaminans LMG 23361]MBH9694349.1 fimbria/pilus periplasmic chaperone [Burkholderia contaminans]MBK1905648.1 fimbria/pilus periplasmic chaperone [Burkholderia contaminans]MBK1913642.1 fimbria/pilus periplasmic chaperone [Burkholderia contaminans]